MTQSEQHLPIRSKNERAKDRASQESLSGSEVSGPEVSGNGAGDAPEDEIAEIRRLAHSRGYAVRREGRARRPRPETRDGRVSTTCRLVPEVRDAMDQARLELNMNYSDMINAGIVMFLQSQNLRIEVDLEGLPTVPAPAPAQAQEQAPAQE